jgi:hypothetical protein
MKSIVLIVLLAVLVQSQYTAKLVSKQETNGSVHDLYVHVTGSGSTVTTVTWDPAGDPSTPVNLFTAGYEVLQLAITSDGIGNIYAVWISREDEFSARQMYGARKTALGEWEEAEQIASEGQPSEITSLDVATDGVRLTFLMTASGTTRGYRSKATPLVSWSAPVLIT